MKRRRKIITPSGCQNPSQEGSGMMCTSQKHAPLAIGHLGCMGCGGGGVCAWRLWWLLFNFMLWLCHVDTTCIWAAMDAAKFIDYVSNLLIILHPILSYKQWGIWSGDIVPTTAIYNKIACCFLCGLVAMPSEVLTTAILCNLLEYARIGLLSLLGYPYGLYP